MFKITMAAARVNAGFTQKQIAERMGLNYQTILNWEKGKVTPKPYQFKMFCDICEIPQDYIFLPMV